MVHNHNKTKAQKSNSNVKDDLKSLPMSELQKKLGSSPDRLTQEEANKWIVEK